MEQLLWNGCGVRSGDDEKLIVLPRIKNWVPILERLKTSIPQFLKYIFFECDFGKRLGHVGPQNHKQNPLEYCSRLLKTIVFSCIAFQILSKALERKATLFHHIFQCHSPLIWEPILLPPLLQTVTDSKYSENPHKVRLPGHPRRKKMGHCAQHGLGTLPAHCLSLPLFLPLVNGLALFSRVGQTASKGKQLGWSKRAEQEAVTSSPCDIQGSKIQDSRIFELHIQGQNKRHTIKERSNIWIPLEAQNFRVESPTYQ